MKATEARCEQTNLPYASKKGFRYIRKHTSS